MYFIDKKTIISELCFIFDLQYGLFIDSHNNVLILRLFEKKLILTFHKEKIVFNLIA